MSSWSMGGLDREARVPVSTVRRVEVGRPVSVTDGPMAALADAPARAGATFLPDDGAGAGLRN